MRWPVLKVMWFREVRDQLRDRRTVFMVVVLPLLLYPILGLGLVEFAVLFSEQPIQIGIAGYEYLEAAAPGTAADARFALKSIPPLIEGERFAARLFKKDEANRREALKVIRDEAAALEKLLQNGTIQAYVVFDETFARGLRQGKQVVMDLRLRSLESAARAVEMPEPNDPDKFMVGSDDDRSRLAYSRMAAVFSEWNRMLVAARMEAAGAPPNYHRPIRFPTLEDKSEKVWSRLFPFLIVMMALTGALYPAIDVCAGEKERGTMETLLISPASRSEIVCSKFLTVWLFSTATALLNLASLAVTAMQLSSRLSSAPAASESVMPAPGLTAVAWCVVLLVPLAALFSATCVALAIYARSTKEGQYYLMPLMIVTLILTFLSLAPGVELTPVYSMLPITGAALLLQALMNATTPDQLPWLYLGPVLLPLAAYCYLALYWAIQQFNREDVLFREAERLDWNLWIKRLLREKEPLPSASMALTFFFLMMLLVWFYGGALSGANFLTQVAFQQLVLLATPAVFMALFLTARPAATLRLAWPPARFWSVALLLALAMHAPLVWVLHAVIDQYPHIKEQLKELSQLVNLDAPLGWQLLVVAALPAICEELAFRGFILSGLIRRLGPNKAILVSSLFFAFAHLNAFRFPATFVLGLVLGLLATRSGSLLPGIMFHMIHNGLLTTLGYYAQLYAKEGQSPPEWLEEGIYSWYFISVSTVVALALLATVYLLPARQTPGLDQLK